MTNWLELAQEICVDPYTKYVERGMADGDAADPLRVRERLQSREALNRRLFDTDGDPHCPACGGEVRLKNLQWTCLKCKRILE